jgi:hypothetical protein
MNIDADKIGGTLTGGCACGAIRYRLDSEPWDGGYCHCTICRRSAGAPVMAFATVPRECFVITKGSAAKWQSSHFGQRGFCRDCGTQLTMAVHHQPDTIDFTIASLDRPDSVVPSYHIWFGNRIPWFDTKDTAPRHEKFRPNTRGLPQERRNGA